jgi:hypothetical protein
MAKRKEWESPGQDLVAVNGSNQVDVLPPNQGFVGRFLTETENMFKARAMRMNGLMRRINESGQRTEALLRTAAERMEAAESRMAEDLRKEGLVDEAQNDVPTDCDE